LKLAILSNVNVDMLSQMLKADFTVFPPQGYGTAMAMLLDPQSDLNRFSPQVIYFIADLRELTSSSYTLTDCFMVIDQWFTQFSSCLKTETQYFVSDAILQSMIQNDDELYTAKLTSYWNQKLDKLMTSYDNVHCFPLSSLAYETGTAFYAPKLWYLGKIPYSAAAFKQMSTAIRSQPAHLSRANKKVLVLDLDNTLWGGILGEDGAEGILLSDDGLGAVYRDVQRNIKRMQQRGTLLAISSKNNAADVDEILSNHPHMVLGKEDFAAMEINWDNKPENIRKMAAQLSLGLDSFVFVDDSPAEREAVSKMLPEVTVPDYPSQPEQLPGFYRQLFTDYFCQLRSTAEDLNKTKQYQENAARAQFASTLDYDTFLQSLELQVKRVSADDTHMNRLDQLLHKTNQFNLTTRRYSLQELSEQKAGNWEYYLFRAADKFGDYGIIAALLVDTTSDLPRIDTFVMSCRIMGKRVEHYILDTVESDLLAKNFDFLTADYVPSPKNQAVSNLYPSLGYKEISHTEDSYQYQIDLRNRPNRVYYVNNQLVKS
jgi:FkbH-like protein